MSFKKISFIFTLPLLLVSCGGSGSSGDTAPVNTINPTPSPSAITSNLTNQAKGTINGEIIYNEIKREFILYIPSSYNSNKKQPLVFNFHGYGSNANEQMNYGDLRAQADANGFVLVHPEALDDIAGKSYWNIGGWSVSLHDDIEFIENLINLMMDKYSINSERIYSTGMSNGGFFSFHLACNLPASFAAVASVTGSMSYETFDSCNPRKPTPVMQIHGSFDVTVPFEGNDILNMKSIMDVMGYWQTNNQCDEYLLSLPGILPGTTSWTETYLYDNCASGTQNILHYVIGAGHIWPGSKFESIQDPNASQNIWNFFEQYDINGVIQ